MKRILAILITISASFGVVSAQESASKDRLEKYVYALAADSMKGRGVNTPEGQKAAEYIVNQFEKVGVKPFGGKYLYPFSFKQGPITANGNNVIGIVEGSDPLLKNEYIVIGAHYDHMGCDIHDGNEVIYNGADDNASGVATIVEVGQLLSAQKELLKRSIIIIAFDGEESGLEGSSAIVRDSIIPLHKVKLMISVDMVGMLKANSNKLNLKGSATLENGNSFFEGIAVNHGIHLKQLGSKVEDRTDTDPFGSIGIPAIAPNTGSKSPYHKPEDDANLLDYEGMATVADFLTDVVVKASNQQLLLAASSFTSKVNRGGYSIFRPGIRVSLGASKHNYPDEFYKAKPLFASQIGVFGRLNLSRKIAFQPEVQYETLGSKTDDGRMRTHALNVPVNILFDLARRNSFENHVFIVLGGYYSYTFAGKIGGKNIDFDNQFNRDDYGLGYGLVFEVMGIQAGVMVKQGLTNLIKDNVPGDIRNTTIYYTLGYKF